MISHLPPFIGTTFLLAMLPGLGQALMTRQALTGGRRPAMASALGTALGIVAWSILAGAGLSAVLLGKPAAIVALRILGGAILLVMGVRMVWAARSAVVPIARSQASEPRGSGRGWARRAAKDVLAGLLVNLGNPKAGVFAIALLPQFVTDRSHAFAQTVLLGVVWGATTFTWYLFYTTLVVRGRQVLASPVAQRRLGLASGGVLATVGIAVAAGL